MIHKLCFFYIYICWASQGHIPQPPSKSVDWRPSTVLAVQGVWFLEWPQQICKYQILIHSSWTHVFFRCFLKWWYPQNTAKWSFLVGKTMVVGYHHFRKPPCVALYWLVLIFVQLHSFSGMPGVRWKPVPLGRNSQRMFGWRVWFVI